MLEMLAQIPAHMENANLGAFYALLVILFKDCLKWLSDARKERAEIRQQSEKENLQTVVDDLRQQTLDRIADSNEAVVPLLGDVKSELARAHAIARLRHEHVCDQLNHLREHKIKPSRGAVDGEHKIFPK